MNDVLLKLHDTIRLKLTGATTADVQKVKRAIGAVDAPTESERDFDLCFVPPTSFNAVWRKLDEGYAYRPDGRILCSGGREKVEIRLPQESVKSPPSLTFVSGSRRLPMLRSMINIAGVRRKFIGVHATAFTFQNHGYLVCGWPGGGKTGTLLAYLLHGAEYHAAEWAYMSEDGQLLHGVPETIRLRDWHVRNARGRLRNVRLRDRASLASIRCAARGVSSLARSIRGTTFDKSKWLSKLSAKLRNRAFVDLPATDLLGKSIDRCVVPIHKILFVGTHRNREILVERLSVDQAKRRLRALQEDDLSDFMQFWCRWNYAFADDARWLTAYHDERETLLENLVRGKECYSIAHPPDVDLDLLFHETQSLTRN